MNAHVARIVVDLVAAAMLGGIVGVQRQVTHKPAGLRTHLLVALGACSFMELSRTFGDTRIAAGVITGIGFLGAGSIVRDGRTPRGLTTAASIWAVAASGLALGAGSMAGLAIGVATTVLTFAALSFTESRIRSLFPERRELDLAVVFDATALSFDAVAALFEGRGIEVKRTEKFVCERAGERLRATWTLTAPDKHRRTLRQAVRDVAGEPGVERVEVTEESSG